MGLAATAAAILDAQQPAASQEKRHPSPLHGGGRCQRSHPGCANGPLKPQARVPPSQVHMCMWKGGNRAQEAL